MKKILWGTFFILIAVLLIMGQVMELPSTIAIIASVFFGAIIIEGLASKSIYTVIYGVTLLTILNKEYIYLEDASSVSIGLAGLLIAIGLSMLFKKNGSSECGSETISYENGEKFDLNLNFGSTIKYVNSEDFRKASINASFAEVKVYFDHAKLVEEMAEIEFDVSFAGVEIYIPRDWRVVNKVNSTFAGVDEKGRSAEPTKTIILKGRASFAGIEITYI